MATAMKEPQQALFDADSAETQFARGQAYAPRGRYLFSTLASERADRRRQQYLDALNAYNDRASAYDTAAMQNEANKELMKKVFEFSQAHPDAAEALSTYVPELKGVFDAAAARHKDDLAAGTLQKFGAGVHSALEGGYAPSAGAGSINDIARSVFGRTTPLSIQRQRDEGAPKYKVTGTNVDNAGIEVTSTDPNRLREAAANMHRIFGAKLIPDQIDTSGVNVSPANRRDTAEDTGPAVQQSSQRQQQTQTQTQTQARAPASTPPQFIGAANDSDKAAMNWMAGQHPGARTIAPVEGSRWIKQSDGSLTRQYIVTQSEKRGDTTVYNATIFPKTNRMFFNQLGANK